MPDKRLITFTIHAILCVQCAMCSRLCDITCFAIIHSLTTALFAYFPHAAVAKLYIQYLLYGCRSNAELKYTHGNCMKI